MIREEAKNIIETEKLQGYNLFENRPNKKEEVGICEKGGRWIVYVTTERTGIAAGSERVFDNESDALENFIKRLRADKRLREIEKRRKERAK